MRLKLENRLRKLIKKVEDKGIKRELNACLRQLRKIKKKRVTFKEKDGRYTISANEFECTECIAVVCSDYEKLKSACVVNKLLSRLGEIEHELL